MFYKIKDIVNIINYTAFLIILFVCSITNYESNSLILIIFFVFFTSYTMRNYLIHSFSKMTHMKFILLLIDLASIYLINIFDVSKSSEFLYLFILDDIILNYSKKKSIILVCSTYILFCFSIYFVFNESLKILVTIAVLSIPIFLIFSIIFILINRLLDQNNIIEQALKEITIKKAEKDNMYNNLKEAYEKVEMMSALKERNKIAREIHDTVGHTLTTVLVELEAAKRLLSKNDSDKASEKMELAQQQVRKGLGDIRNSVRILENGDDVMDFFPSLNTLISDCEKHWEVVIRSQIDDNLNIYPTAKKVIYSALQEGLTNGIRHGKSTAFLFKLYKIEDMICFSLEDNGKGSPVITPGFGLRAMRERVMDLKGKFDINSSENEGFSITFTFPIIERKD